MENMKFINMELESIKYIEEVNKNPDLKEQHDKQRKEDKSKKMEMVKIPVSELF